MVNLSKQPIKMRKADDLHDRALQVAADTYRLNLFNQLTGRTTPKGPSVSDGELTEAIRQSFTQVSDGRFREMIELSTDAALEAYDRVSAAFKFSRSRRSN
ncbi:MULTISPECIES: hypothetical protein [unclassified Bradyrhizobium]|jgi:hypothetical protein|uniref:hypothetical protein n=1 Tax=unclassified Bradyrhizobium TaxID=2631580 RepID=UPI001FFAE02E|nr:MULTISPECIES: hypothetical protein [unclassified Bradyrhizobium]